MADGHFRYLENITRSQTGKIFVARYSGEIVGFLVCFVEQLDQEDLHVVESERKYGYISDLYVSPSIRKQGVGIVLMQAAESIFAISA
ncbi:GNAT family N-acetyltransferase [Calothrix sp. NIES-3974]|uniref:GNAT family N-acetyltransferase n=1 Tax=Calothrix sp. NIES-3974 TaxID=2005462 RepID=UPI0018D56AF7|nr:GNAT family N-acetyltransferase [Calothrix sp. NIES-3974]